jgi:uncharacterized RDD family membrane protein YckC
MTSSTSPQPSHDVPAEPLSPLGPLGRFVLSPVFLALLGCSGVISVATAGFLSARWLGFLLLGLGCFVLMALIRALAE